MRGTRAIVAGIGLMAAIGGISAGHAVLEAHQADAVMSAVPTLPASGAAQSVRLATLDIYQVIDRLLGLPDSKQAQKEFKDRWEPRLAALQRELRRLDADLQVVPQSDPRYQDLARSARERQGEYERLAQEYARETEAFSSRQLIEAYGRARQAAARVAERLGYTHVLATRSFDRPIAATTLGNTIQELLARPVMHGVAGDEITGAVLTELGLEP